MDPRIYLYKITFIGQPYWYWGVHKEKKYEEYYMGSPVTNKEYWNLYEPEKEILRVFEYSEKGWAEALEAERELIRLDLNNTLCLNESCGGRISLRLSSKMLKELWQDSSYREKMSALTSERNKLLWQDEAFRKARSAEATLQWQDEALLEFHYSRLKDFWSLDENRQNQSEKMTAYWSDQYAREAHSKRMKEVYEYNPEVGKKISEKLKELWLDPEYKEKAIASRLGKGTLSPEEITSRFKLIEESGIDIYSPGWVTRVSNLWGVSHTTVRRTFNKYWGGSPPYKRSW